MSEITLPKEVVKAEVINPKMFIMYSAPKVGKTTLAAELEGNLLIDLEEGSDYVNALKVKANSLKELGAIGKKILDEGKPYKYVTIDTLSALEEMCEKSATEKYKNSNMGKNFKGDSVLELPMGAGYLPLRLEMKRWVAWLKTLAENVIFIGHLADKYITDNAGKEVLANDLSLTGKLKQIICADADAIAYLYRNKENKIIATFGTKDTVTCGSRCEHLIGQEFEFDWKKIYK